jgi:hypothetical protein
LENNEHFHPWKLVYRNYSFQKLIQFSKVNHVLYATASSRHAFFCRSTRISST